MFSVILLPGIKPVWVGGISVFRDDGRRLSRIPVMIFAVTFIRAIGR